MVFHGHPSLFRALSPALAGPLLLFRGRRRGLTFLVSHRIEYLDRRTMLDFAHCMKDLVDVHLPDAEKIVLVMDNLNTHKFASLYHAFAPEEARRIIAKLEIHYTPKHGSWLNMAEIELSVLQRQCTKARIPDQTTLRTKVMAWQVRRNQKQSTVHWRFTTDDARIKLHRLYPTIDAG